MARRRIFFDLLAPAGRGSSPEADFTSAIERLVKLAGATAGALSFAVERGVPIVVTAGARRDSPLDAWLRARVAEPSNERTSRTPSELPAGWRGPAPASLEGALGERAAPVGRYLLLRRRGRRAAAAGGIPPGFARKLGLAMERIWRMHERTLRLEVINEVMALTAANLPLDQVYRSAAAAVGRVVRFDGFGLALMDRERREVSLIEVPVSAPTEELRERRLPLSGTLAAWVATHRSARRVDDATGSDVPPTSRAILSARGAASAVLVPLFSQGEVLGALAVGHRERHAFTDGDAEILTEVARPLAAAIERARLHAEITERAEELGALNRTSQLVSARLDLASLLETISRSVTGLMDSTGCGIGLFNPERTAIAHVAAHGVRTDEWRTLEIPLGDGLIGQAAARGKPVLERRSPERPAVALVRRGRARGDPLAAQRCPCAWPERSSA